MPTAFSLVPADLFANGRTPTFVAVGGGNDYYNVGNGAYWQFTTSARYMEVDSYCTADFYVGNQPPRPCVRTIQGSVVEDRFFTLPAAVGPITTRMILPIGSDKTVQIFVPAQYATSPGGSPIGVYPIRVRFDQNATAVSPSLEAEHVVIYGDSIASGGLGVCPTLLGYAGLMQRPAAAGGYDGSVTLVSHGYRRLIDDCSTGGARTAFAAYLLSFLPTAIILAIGSNDAVVVPALSLVDFTTYYEGLMDAIHAADADMQLVCFSPILRGGEGPNHIGLTMQDYRDIIDAAVTARSGWSFPPYYLDGLPICELTDLADGTHPSTEGNLTKMLPAVLAVFSGVGITAGGVMMTYGGETMTMEAA